MAQFKQFKSNKKPLALNKKPEEKKPQLKFASSDEEEDDDESDEIDDEEMDEEVELDAEDEDESEEDEEDNGPLTKTPVKANLKGSSKTEEKRNVLNGAPKKMSTGGDASTVSQSSVSDKERREERDKCTLFVKSKHTFENKINELKALHPDIVTIHEKSNNAWLVFPSEAACKKAYKKVSAGKFKGEKLQVDFCGSKAKNPKIIQPDFVTSDEEEDDDESEEDEMEDEEMDEEVEAEDEESDEEEEEKNNESVDSTKTPIKGALKGLNKPLPSKPGDKRKAAEAVDKKTNVEHSGAPAAKQFRPSDILSEEERRREERNKRSLFVKGACKLVKNTSELKALHPDVVAVRTMGVNAWLLFANEATCEKAHEKLSVAKVKGKNLELDFCGSKAKNPNVANKKSTSAERPIDKTTLLIIGIPVDITAEKLKLIFPVAKQIDIPKPNKKSKRKALNNAFIKFANEQEAQVAFKKGESLKIGGLPVDVIYARKRNNDQK